ncbi:hypothetical protein AYK26_07245 [Euryarchaeota archaeon SM23-78]|nr:MAG: hypothetical protein AYK26_07245 [Euryarchaeota archaeon SM23-78]
MRIPSLPSTGRTISIYYKNNTAISSGENPTGVWDNNYVGVWHMTETSGTRYDSTSNKNNLTPMNTTFSGTGVIAGATDFENNTQSYLMINDSDQTGLDLNNSDYTFSFWFKPEDSVGDGYSFYDKGYPGVGGNCYGSEWNDWEGWCISHENGGWESEVSSFDTEHYGVWAYYAVSFNVSNGDMIFSRDGVFDAPDNMSTSPPDNDRPFDIGRKLDRPWLDGLIDEFRVSNTPRSNNWINMSYLIMVNHSDFVSYSDEETRQGYFVLNPPTGARLVLESNTSTDVTTSGQTGIKKVLVGLNTTPGNYSGILVLNFTDDIDMSDLVLNTSLSLTKSVLHNSSQISNKVNVSLLIPRVDNSGRVYVCQNATGMSQVNTSCLNKTSIELGQTNNGMTLSEITYDTETYYLVENITGSGGGEGPGNWSNTSLDKCMNITITNSGSETLYNFPAYINLTYDNDMLPDFKDIRFYGAACDYGGAKLNYEIENHTTSTRAHTWVRIPSLPGTGRKISVYYKNTTGIGSGENATGVWDSYYLGVWHLKETSTDSVGEYGDSTSNNYNGTGVNTPSRVEGRIAFGQDFDFSSVEYINGTDIQHNTTWNGTISVWTDSDNIDRDQYIVNHVSSNIHRVGIGTKNTGNGVWTMFRYIVGTGWEGVSGNASDGWHHLVLVINNTSVKGYVDGIELNGSLDNLGTTMNNSFSIGARVNGADEYDGQIDEVRHSSIPRSLNWINLSYLIVANHSDYVTYGSESNQYCNPTINATLTENITCADMFIPEDVILNTSIYSINATGDFVINGTLEASLGGNQWFGSLTINSGGTYNATSKTTIITNETSGGYAIDIDGSFNHNSGKVTINTSSNTSLDLNASSGVLYNLEISTGNSSHILEPDSGFVINNNLIIRNGTLNILGYNITVGSVHSNGTINLTAGTLLNFSSTEGFDYDCGGYLNILGNVSNKVLFTGTYSWDMNTYLNIYARNVIFEKFGAFLSWKTGLDIINATFRNSSNFVYPMKTITNFKNIIMHDINYLRCGWSSDAVFVNITILNTTSAYDVGLYGDDILIEFVNSSFNISAVNLAVGNLSWGGGDIISKNHNDVTNEYWIVASSLNKSELTNDFGSLDNVHIHNNGTHNSTFIIDEAWSYNSISVNNSAILSYVYNGTDVGVNYYKQNNGKVYVNNSAVLITNQSYFNNTKIMDNTTGAAYWVDDVETGSSWIVNKWWMNNNLDRCMNITIANSGSENLTNFPAYINLTYDNDMLPDFKDIRFYSFECENGGQLLDYEIENYTTNSRAHIWVRIPSLPETGKTISIYYKNNTEISSGENPTGVWDNNYVMVHHLEENCASANCTIDSTQYANNGTPYNNTGTTGNLFNASGRIGPGYKFDGNNDYVSATVSQLTFNDGDEYTISAWFKAENTSNWKTLFEKSDNLGNFWNNTGVKFWVDNEVLYLRLNSGTQSIHSGYITSIGNWYYITARMNQEKNMTLYVDGNYIGSANVTDNISAGNTETFRIGIADVYYGDGWEGDFNGTIDEVRVSNTSRSLNWINMSYLIVNNQSDYVSFSNEAWRTHNVTDCDVISSGGVYELTNHVNSSGTCFNIKADNITLDCKGYNITWALGVASLGVNNTAGYDNITIRNCVFEKPMFVGQTLSDAVYFIGSLNPVFINNTIINYYGYGLRLQGGSHNANISDNNINPIEFFNGIYLASSDNATIQNNNFTSNGNRLWPSWNNKAIYLYNSRRAELYNNAVTSNYWSALDVEGSQTAHFNHTIGEDNTLNGTSIRYIAMESNKAYQDVDWTNYSVAVFNVTNITFTNMTFDHICFGYETNQVNLSNSTIRSSGFVSLELEPVTNIEIRNNFINHTKNTYTIAMRGSSTYNLSFINNTIRNTGDTTTIYQSGGRVNFNLYNNTINATNAPGIYSYPNDNTINIFEGNTIYTAGASNHYGIRLNTMLDLVILKKNKIISSGVALLNRLTYDAGTRIIIVNDTTLNSTGNYSFMIQGDVDGVTNFTNVTIANNNKSISSQGNFIFNVFWYMDMNITNTTGAPISGANVTITDVNGTFVYTELTAADGTITKRVYQEYWENATADGYYTNYTVTAFKSGLGSNSTQVNLSTNRLVHLALTNQLTACGDLDTANTVYNLTQNVSSADTCFNITANNVTLECNHYTINYSQSIYGNPGVSFYNSNLSTVRNCKIVRKDTSTASAASGIFINAYSNNCTIRNNTIITGSSNNDNNGILIYGSGNGGNHNKIINNNITTTSYRAAGISLGYDADNNTVFNNTITTTAGSSAGISLITNRYTNITENTITTLSEGVSVGCIWTWCDHTVKNNTVNGKPILYYYNNDSLTIENNKSIGQLILARCNNITIRNLTMSVNNIHIIDTPNATIENTNITPSGNYTQGLVIYRSENNIVNNTNITTQAGNALSIFYEDSEDNLITNSRLTTTGTGGVGIHINSQAYNNNFTNLIINTSGTNSYGVYLLYQCKL